MNAILSIMASYLEHNYKYHFHPFSQLFFLSSVIHMEEYKVVVFGPGGVGKTSLILQYLEGKFETYDPTIEDSYRKEITVRENPAVLEILDTAGSECLSTMQDAYIKSGQGFVIVYSARDSQTLNDIKPFRSRMLQVKGPEHNAPIILVANKWDLQAEREPAVQDGESLATEWGCPFFKASAKTPLNVNEIFTSIVHQIISRREEKHSKGSCVVN